MVFDEPANSYYPNDMEVNGLNEKEQVVAITFNVTTFGSYEGCDDSIVSHVEYLTCEDLGYTTQIRARSFYNCGLLNKNTYFSKTSWYWNLPDTLITETVQRGSYGDTYTYVPGKAQDYMQINLSRGSAQLKFKDDLYKTFWNVQGSHQYDGEFNESVLAAANQVCPFKEIRP